jgi:hypothetical protein
MVIGVLMLATACSTVPTSDPESYRGPIRVAIQARARDLRECYYKLLETKPGAEGRINLGWEIVHQDGRGKAQNLRVVDEDPKLSGIGPCMISVLETIAFPPPSSPDETVVIGKYPFLFDENGKFRPQSAPQATP